MNLEESSKPAGSVYRILIKLDRWAAWLLMLVILTYAVTGYGMTKGLIDPSFARTWHLGWLGILGLLSFIIHTAWAIHLSLRRWHLWNMVSKISLLSFYLALAAFFLYVHFFYANTDQQDQVKVTPMAYNQSSVEAGSPTKMVEGMVFTAESLSVYNGRNGQPAYAAVDGLVYDFSRLFRNGQHEGHAAGQDLSAAFHSEHPNNYLKKYRVVGTYSE